MAEGEQGAACPYPGKPVGGPSGLHSLFKIFYLFIFRAEKGGGKRGRETSCVVSSGAPHTGDLAHNPGMCPDWESNPRPFDLQGGTQSTEPHQPERIAQSLFFKLFARIWKSDSMNKPGFLACLENQKLWQHVTPWPERTEKQMSPHTPITLPH